jgi:predicted unusual protein kinase regulating ubiquinone biosynthesis (AarF/ABC1/UbiB family)
MTPRRLGAAERLYRARRIGTTFGRVYLGIKANQFLARRLRPPDMAQRWSRHHHDSARAIYEAAVELKGMILKGCQFMGARADVLPPEYVEVLSRLQDRVPARPFRVVRRFVEQEYDADLDEVFAEFSRRPVASASLAQVHEARLHDGRRVAVKVQYPEIESLVRSDLSNLRTLFRAVGLLERDVDLMPLIDELAVHVPLELDFENEGRNAERVAAMLSHRSDVKVPEVIWEHTTARILCMEFIDGIKVTETERLRQAGIDSDTVVRGLIEVWCEQILRHGFFHADPHPGNLMVEPDTGRLVLLDFGLTKELPAHFRESILAFAAGLIRGDAEAMVSAFVALGFETRDGSHEGLVEVARFALEFAQRVRERAWVEERMFARWNEELADEIRRNPIVRVPGHVMLLGRVLGLLSGVSRSLGSKVDLLPVVLPYVFQPAAPAAPQAGRDDAAGSPP